MSARKRTAARKKLAAHNFAGVGVCCNLPRKNEVHDPANLPQRTDAERAYEAARLGEHEEEQ